MKLKKKALPWLIISILVIVGEITLNVYKFINNSIETFDLIIDIFLILVMISSIFSCFEKKDK